MTNLPKYDEFMAHAYETSVESNPYIALIMG